MSEPLAGITSFLDSLIIVYEPTLKYIEDSLPVASRPISPEL